MSEISEAEVQESKEKDKAITEAFGEKFLALSKDEQASLSKVLFPDTHTDKIQFVGIERTLRPLTLKYSKRLFSLVSPISKQLQANAPTNQVVDMTAGTVEILKDVSMVLAEFYEWGDAVEHKIREDDVSFSELQALACTQLRLNGANDFLLGPLRVVVRVMQIHEVASIKFHTMFFSRVSPESGSAL